MKLTNKTWFIRREIELINVLESDLKKKKIFFILVTIYTFFHGVIYQYQQTNSDTESYRSHVWRQAHSIIMSLIKTITTVLKVLTYIITSITARSIKFAAMLAKMLVLTFITAIIVYIYCKNYDFFKIFCRLIIWEILGDIQSYLPMRSPLLSSHLY